jgi:hypothetical protein
MDCRSYGNTTFLVWRTFSFNGSAGRALSIRVKQRRSVGAILLIIFFATGALICFTVVLALAFPTSFFDAIWRLKPSARREFQEIGVIASIALMLIVGLACGAASIGLARKREWGRRLAIIILFVNLMGDSLNALLRHDPKTLIGLPIGGLMIWYLVKHRSAT